MMASMPTPMASGSQPPSREFVEVGEEEDEIDDEEERAQRQARSQTGHRQLPTMTRYRAKDVTTMVPVTAMP